MNKIKYTERISTASKFDKIYRTYNIYVGRTKRVHTIFGRIIYLNSNILRHTTYLNFNLPFNLTKQYVDYLRIMHYFIARCLITL